MNRIVDQIVKSRCEKLHEIAEHLEETNGLISLIQVFNLAMPKADKVTRVGITTWVTEIINQTPRAGFYVEAYTVPFELWEIGRGYLLTGVAIRAIANRLLARTRKGTFFYHETSW